MTSHKGVNEGFCSACNIERTTFGRPEWRKQLRATMQINRKMYHKVSLASSTVQGREGLLIRITVDIEMHKPTVILMLGKTCICFVSSNHTMQ